MGGTAQTKSKEIEMAHTKHKSTITQPIITRTRHHSIRLIHETFTPGNIPVRQHSNGTFESILCIRNGCQRFFSPSYEGAQEKAENVLRNLDFNSHTINTLKE